MVHIGDPDGALTRVAADANDALLAERSDQPKSGDVVGCKVAAALDRGFVAQPDEIRGNRLPRVLVGDRKARADPRMTSTGSERE
jgi:hypothetical protein